MKEDEPLAVTLTAAEWNTSLSLMHMGLLALMNKIRSQCLQPPSNVTELNRAQS